MRLNAIDKRANVIDRVLLAILDAHERPSVMLPLVAGVLVLGATMYWLAVHSTFGALVMLSLNVLLAWQFVRVILYTSSRITIGGHFVTKIDSTHLTYLSIGCIVFFVYFSLSALGCLAQFVEALDLIHVHDDYTKRMGHAAAMNAILTDILDADPRIFGKTSMGVLVASWIYILKFMIIALIIPLILAALSSSLPEKKSK